jgi:hypothetical protein
MEVECELLSFLIIGVVDHQHDRQRLITKTDRGVFGFSKPSSDDKVLLL